ncbi:MAG: DUF167 domain-containing protein [Elusimicrobia bacterium]|nr:DUF167 domain-containing protein [Elusimicrobiota bacterium]
MPRWIRVKAHPGSREDSIEAKGQDSYEVRVRAKAQAGKANEAVLSRLSRHLGLERKRLRLVKGGSSPNKIVAVLGS